MIRMRRLIAKSWGLSRLFYWLRGRPLEGRPQEEIWYLAYGANMHDSVLQDRRGMRPLEWRAGRILGYRLRFNLEGRPAGKAAPANLFPDADAEVWGVLYRITRHQLVQLDATEGMRYRHVWADAEDKEGRRLHAVSYLAAGKETDGNPSLRYLTLLRGGARAHGLPKHWVRYLDGIKHAE
jgi:cation transport regulator ChaC